MKRIAATTVAALALAIPALALADDTSSSSSTDSAAAACRAERDQMGVATFRLTYGTNHNRHNAFGKCVSKKAQAQDDSAANAAQACRAEQADPNFAASHDGKSFDEFYGTGKKGRNAFGKCVSSKAHDASDDVSADVNAAHACKKLRKDDPAAFAAQYGSRRNAFGKCVSDKAHA
jgi:1,4-alpha-glucan branching enzyme